MIFLALVTSVVVGVVLNPPPRKRSVDWDTSCSNKKTTHNWFSSRTHESNQTGNQSDSTSIASAFIVSTSSVKNSTLKESEMKEVTSVGRNLKEVIYIYNHPPNATVSDYFVTYQMELWDTTTIFKEHFLF